jgi:hypothetical protein
MNSLWGSKVPAEGAAANKAAADITDAEIADVGPESSDRAGFAAAAPHRPPLQRNQQPQGPLPAVPQPPPPPPSSSQQPQQPPDSLSLAQLRRIVAEFPRGEPVAYDYVYADMGPIEEEIDEWFVYNFWQWVRLNSAQRNFYAEWADTFEDERPWKDADEEDRRGFVTELLRRTQSQDASARGTAIGALAYLVLGRWTESIVEPILPSLGDDKIRSVANSAQLEAMRAGVELVAECGGISIIWDAMRKAFEPFWYAHYLSASSLNTMLNHLGPMTCSRCRREAYKARRMNY